MKVIAIDSSGLVASVAIVEDELLIAEYNIQYKKTHSQTLLPMLDEIKKMTELSLETVDAIAIAAGPGSFTGLRIGSSTAKAFGFALNIPLVEISTLEALAYNLYGTDKLICPLMDARRNQVYTGIYEFNNYELSALLSGCVISIDEISTMLNQTNREVILIGDGVAVYIEMLKSLLTVPYHLAPAHQNRQRAASMAVLAMKHLKEGKTVDASNHAPIYYRMSQAEREKADKTKPDVNIRPMTAADIEVISRIESRVFSMPWKAEDFLAMVSEEFAHYYVAEIKGKPIGAIGMRNIKGDAQITNFLVDVPYQRRGIGRKMIDFMINDTKEAVEIYSLEVRVTNSAAISLYESIGFKFVGKRADFYEKPTEDALLYQYLCSNYH
ncbi:MAG: tRNA (adenosine(37)-N6)-threonylcarbamoyltransferase complex dimerization subunit type 1 TsaB [Lachnospiraceae bacterium]|nr:tRNA (adenosine(37)-N6)-threonylcarbamoyltransferase complex dimerization subunit type 1 TsaB [Lachnospiraceae bacterium]